MARRPRLATELSDQLCECGCGERTKIAARTYADRSVVAGQPRRFVYGHHVRGARVEVAPGAWVRPQPRGPRKLVRHEVRDCGFETPCWVWLLAVDVHGYPKMSRGGVRLKAHRVAFADEFGPVPEGHDVHHRCEVKRCVNPEHLQALSKFEHGQLHRDLAEAA